MTEPERTVLVQAVAVTALFLEHVQRMADEANVAIDFTKMLGIAIRVRHWAKESGKVLDEDHVDETIVTRILLECM